MRTHYSPGPSARQDQMISIEADDRFGPVEFQNIPKDDIYNQILDRTKEFVNWIPPMNIVQGLDYMKLEFIVPGISKKDCKVGGLGSLLWIKISKAARPGDDIDIFYRTFILPEGLINDQVTAVYQPGKLTISIPKKIYQLQ